jgi:hypothetical protein
VAHRRDGARFVKGLRSSGFALEAVGMKHVMYAEKSLLMDDESADALMEYAAAIAENNGGDTVKLRAVGEDGNAVDVSILLNSATVLIVETASADLAPPKNEETVEAMRRKTGQLRQPPPAQPFTPSSVPDYYDFDEIR